MTVLIDLETTGLTMPSVGDLSSQPHIIELYACKINDKFEVVGEIDTFIKPPIPIPQFITKITGINDFMVKDAPKFAAIYEDLARFFLGEEIMVAHNIEFDSTVLYYELLRLNKHRNFPFPPISHCTVEMSKHIKGHRLKLSKLHELATGTPHEDGAHRAKADVMAMLDCYKWLMS